MSEVCVELLDEKEELVNFCAVMEKHGCIVLSVNTLGPTSFVWIENSARLQMHLVQMAHNQTCAGFNVCVHEKKPRGTPYIELQDKSWFDVLLFVKEHSEIKSWSPPTCFDRKKKTFK